MIKNAKNLKFLTFLPLLNQLVQQRLFNERGHMIQFPFSKNEWMSGQIWLTCIFPWLPTCIENWEQRQQKVHVRTWRRTGSIKLWWDAFYSQVNKRKRKRKRRQKRKRSKRSKRIKRRNRDKRRRNMLEPIRYEVLRLAWILQQFLRSSIKRM